MENIEKLKIILEEINPEWSNLKKARYICNKICQIYEYSPEFNYADSSLRDEILLKSIQLSDSKSEEELENSANVTPQICVGMATIYARMLKQAGIQNVEQMYGDVIFEIDKGKSTVVSIVKELYAVKLKERPKGFESGLLNDLEKIDRELGFIDELGYRENENYNVKEIVKSACNFETRLERVLNDRGEYIRSVLGDNIKNVELHQYYRYLMNTAFPKENIVIRPVDKEYLKGIKYALIAKPKEGDYLYYLYNTNQGMFIKTNEQDIVGRDINVKELNTTQNDGCSKCYRE